MSTAGSARLWVFSALVSAGVHAGAVAGLVATLPALDGPTAPTQFVLASLEVPGQVEVEAMMADAVTPAAALAAEPAAAKALTMAPVNIQATRVEAVAASIPQAQALSVTPATEAIAATVAAAGQAAVNGPQAQVGRLQPAAGARLPVTTTAVAAGTTGTPAIVPTASALAPMGTTGRAEAQVGGPAAATAVPTGSTANPVIAKEAATAAVAAAVAGAASTVTTVQSMASVTDAMEISTVVQGAPALAPMSAADSAEGQAGIPIAITAVPTGSTTNPAIAMDIATAALAADAAGIASSVATVQSTAPMAGAMATSTVIPTAPAVAPVSASARAEGQIGNPQSAASPILPTAGAAAPVIADQGLPAAAAEMAGAVSTTALSTTPVAGAQVQAPRPTATLATPIIGAQTFPVVVGAEEGGSAGIAPSGAAPVAVTAALSATGATLSPLPPDVEPVPGLDAINDYLAGYDGGDCFAVLPQSSDGGTVALTAFTGSPAAAGDFIQALARDFGTLLLVEARPVSAEQCGALSFVRSSALYPGFDLGLALDADVIAAGSPIGGQVLHMTGVWLTLVVIDDEGRVSNLDAYVRRAGEAIRFEAPVVPTGGAAGKTQLVLAVATAEQLTTNPQDGEPAQAFLSALEAELRMRGIGVELAVAAFTVH